MDANDIKMDIIKLASKIDDLNKLKLIYKNAERVDKLPNGSDSRIGKPDFTAAIVQIREGVSFEQILREQDYRPISYEEFRELADQIEWGHSLEELLNALD